MNELKKHLAKDLASLLEKQSVVEQLSADEKRNGVVALLDNIALPKVKREIFMKLFRDDLLFCGLTSSDREEVFMEILGSGHLVTAELLKGLLSDLNVEGIEITGDNIELLND